MVKLACLSELTGAMLHIILANGFIGTDREHGFAGIDRRLHSSSALHIGRVVVFTRGAVFASTRAQVVSAVFSRLRAGSRSSLSVGRRNRHRVALCVCAFIASIAYQQLYKV